MEPISRRHAVRLGALGVAGVVIGAAGLSQTRTPTPPRIGGHAFVEPSVLSSRDQTLRVEMETAEREVTLAGRRATVLSFNGTVPGPTLRLQPGDRLQVAMTNNLSTSTNLHVHGLHVSPQGASDNPFVNIAPGETYEYDFQIPIDHPTGTFWYHPHLHGSVADQVFGGLYGAIVIAGEDEPPSTRERLLIVSDITLDSAGRVPEASPGAVMMGREGDLVLVNGQISPQLVARPGERERWRVVNTCTSRYLRLELPGQHLQLLGLDVDAGGRPRDIESVLLAPGNRADLLVTAQGGTSVLRTVAYDRGSTGMGMMDSPSGPSGAVTLATLSVTGTAASRSLDLPERPIPVDLRGDEPSQRRVLTLGAGMGMRFTIDGKEFDHHRTDTAVLAGAVEEWTIRNTSPMDHPFHLHVWPMQVIEQDGSRVTEPTWRDVVNVPAGGQTVVRVAFNDYTGRTVYHCHILDHEDAGMMGVVEVA
ncbi:multicopper oxidase family protein [Sanguibacter antarcticus]|uniref:FtsP/CotA-like multicopper oxidase with cupredoxin domain n=1 Tax=Sanguibacter antarcticus TaxID=372484 RepID=A0A2A9E035_9MICO|nr:multicopper oxidase family protein [Sanguibacter antarcticus]PFG32407.1 FtsP/CotA-like multicopper oxidase with cupredoxin domain [Sanguibacter antarcticus]